MTLSPFFNPLKHFDYSDWFCRLKSGSLFQLLNIPQFGNAGNRSFDSRAAGATVSKAPSFDTESAIRQ